MSTALPDPVHHGDVLARIEASEPCFCSCHYWPHCSHGSPCCSHTGLQHTGYRYVPWPEPEPEDGTEDVAGDGYVTGPWWSS